MKEEKKWISRWTGGFTLVELIVVLVILSILSAVAVPTVLGFIDDGKAKECRTQVEALTAEVSSAKMAAEVDGKEGGTPFDVQAYINAAGASGKCPVDGKAYEYEQAENKIVCPNNHGESTISGNGKFTVAVVEDKNMRETEPADSGETNEEKPQPSLELNVPGNVELEKDEGKNITASVTPKNLDGKDVQYTYEWGAPPNSGIKVDKVSEDGSTVTVTGETAGGYDITCKVTGTYTDENGETKTVTDEKTIHVTVTDSKPAPSVSLEVTPGSINDLGEGESRELTAKVTPQGLEGKENVEYHYEWKSSDSSVTVTQTGDGSTATVKGESSGGSSTVTCTVTVTYTENGETKTVTDEKTVDVKVKEAQTEAPQPELNLEVPPLTVKEGETGKLEPKASGGSGNYTYEYRIVEPGTETETGTVTVDEDGTVHGKKSGKAKVEVTVTDTITDETKTQEVEVNVTEGGLFDPHTFQFWTNDAASVELHTDEEFKKLLAKLPPGMWSIVSGDVTDYSFLNGGVKLHPMHYADGSCATDFVLRYTTTDGVTDELIVKVGYVIGGIQAPHSLSDNGSEAIFTAIPSPEYTTDVPFTWEIVPTQDSAEVEWSYANEKHTQIKVKKSLDGQCKFKARAYTTRQKTGERVESDWSNELTVAKKMLITNVTLSPSPLVLKVGQTATITATPECDSSVEMSKVRYAFKCEAAEVANVEKPSQQQSDNKTTVKGLKAGSAKVIVDVFYDDTWMTYAQCDVTVLKEEEVLIDAKKFKANSWDNFKAAVEATTSNQSYKINQHKNEEGQDSPLYYDSDGKLYVAIGTGKSYKRTDTKGKEVLDSNSFADYISKGENYTEEEFAPIDMPVKVADTVKWSDLGNNSKVYNVGEIIKVIRDDRGGEVEYYITNVKKDADRVQSNIKTDEHSGWWKLDVLP